MNSYFFLTNSIETGKEKDPVKVIAKKYGKGKRQIEDGILVSLCAIQANTAPAITEIVLMRTRQEVIDLIHPNFPGFNGQQFINKWEHN